MEQKEKHPPVFAPQTDADEVKLMDIKKEDIHLEDTTLSGLVNFCKHEHKAVFQLSSWEGHEKMLKWLQDHHDDAQESEGKIEEQMSREKESMIAVNTLLMN